MLVTEKQASKMACCGQTTFVNLIRDDGQPDKVTPLCCIGSECMAWRWKPGQVPPREGYCGLAGRAE